MGRYLYLLHCKHQVGGTKPAPIAQYWQAKGYRRRGTINIVPKTLNLKSKAEWVTCYIKQPDGCVANDIEFDTVLSEGIEVQQSIVQDGVLAVKFGKQDSMAYIRSLGLGLPAGVTQTVAGKLEDDTTSTESDTARAMTPGRGPEE